MSTIYKEYSNGRWNYRVWSFDEQRYYPVTREQAERMVAKRAARIVEVQ